MISLILPYWRRAQAAHRALDLIVRQYDDLHDLEVIVVDDGSDDGFQPDPRWQGSVRFLRLPAKSDPLNPCVPFNAGVEASTGEVIALSCVEILHDRGAVLGKMLDALRMAGPDAYVQAACWATDNKVWHAHSSVAGTLVEKRKMPAGGCFHFMSMLRRELWERAGGFDCDYRAGAGYEDPDLLLRLERAGARFVMRDDLVVSHPRIGVRAAWTREMHERNRQVFRTKWC